MPPRLMVAVDAFVPPDGCVRHNIRVRNLRRWNIAFAG
jgi:hypothetical protein